MKLEFEKIGNQVKKKIVVPMLYHKNKKYHKY